MADANNDHGKQNTNAAASAVAPQNATAPSAVKPGAPAMNSNPPSSSASPAPPRPGSSHSSNNGSQPQSKANSKSPPIVPSPYTVLPPNFPTPSRNSNSPAEQRDPSTMGPPSQSASQHRNNSFSTGGQQQNNGQQPQQRPEYNSQPSGYPFPFTYAQQQNPPASSPSPSPGPQPHGVPSYPPVPNFPWAANGATSSSTPTPSATPRWPLQSSPFDPSSPTTPRGNGQNAPFAAPGPGTNTSTPGTTPAPKPKKPSKKKAAAGAAGPDGKPPAKKQATQNGAAPAKSATTPGPESNSTHPSAAIASPYITSQQPTPFNAPNPSSDQQPRDANQVLDVLGGSGIDLQAEEEAMRARQGPQPLASAQQAYVNQVVLHSTLPTLQLYPLSTRVHSIASQHDLPGGIDSETLNVLSAAARIRFRNLIEAMVAASRHRCWSTHQRSPPMHQRVTEDPLDGSRKTKLTKRPMYHEELVSDPSSWIAAIEKADRGEEAKARRRRAQRQKEALMAANGGVMPSGSNLSGEAGDGQDLGGGGEASVGEGWDKKRKKPVSARNMSEDVRRRLANNTAARALGGPATPKWTMMGGGGAGGGTTPIRNGDGNDDVGDTSTSSTPGGGGSSLPKPRFAPAASTSNLKSLSGSDAASQWAAARASANLSLAPNNPPSSTTTGGGKVNPHGWGDPALRALAREEEERKKSKRVKLIDAIHAVETERKSGIGSGSGAVAVWKRRCLGGDGGGAAE
ncbi:unnamed protein product [Sympodiomycopsis kandeliae]